MSRQAYATVQALGEWLGEPVEQADQARAERLLRAASNLISAYTGITWQDDTVPEEVEDITLAVASRYYVNPTAETNWTRQIDDAMDGGGRKVEESGLYLTASEKQVLKRLMAQQSTTIMGLRTVSTSRGECMRHPTVWEDEREQHLWATITG